MKPGRPRGLKAGRLRNMLLINNNAVGRLWRTRGAESHDTDVMSSSDQRSGAALDAGLLDEGVQRLAKAKLRRRQVNLGSA